jgi:hypothetical protein
MRNPKYNEQGTIDCEIEIREGVWVPFTANPDDVEESGREIYATALAASPAAYVAPDPAIALAQARAGVNRERDLRMTSTFAFAGKDFDCDQASLARITGAATLAGFAMGAGAPAGFMRWHGGASDFAWIAADNTLFPMDAQTCFAFGQAAANNQSAYIFAAKAIKGMDPIPADFAANADYWP